MGSGRGRAEPRRRDALDRHLHRHRGHAARVQVRAELLGLRREGRVLRRDRQPAAHPELRRRRSAGGQRHGAELAQRGALR